MCVAAVSINERWSPERAPGDSLSDGVVSLRRWRVDDAETLHRLISDNVEHLRPWMPWIAREPAPIAERVALLESWDGAWASRTEFPLAIVVDGRVVGSTGLHCRQGRGVLDIGYWIEAAHTGRGFVTRTARLLASEALSLHDVRAVEIHHDVYNVASAGVAERAGFTAVADYEREPEVPDGGRVFRRWVLAG